MTIVMNDQVAWLATDGMIEVNFSDGRTTRVGGLGAAILNDIIEKNDPIAAESARSGDSQEQVATRVNAFIESAIEAGILTRSEPVPSPVVKARPVAPRRRRRMRRHSTYNVLFVCTANICRSAYAHALMESYGFDHVTISSAGTHALVGQGMDREMARQLPDGVDGSAHVAQQLTLDLAESADLIVAMSERHRTFIIDEWPHLASTTFLIGQVGRGIAEVGSMSEIASHLWKGRTVLPSDSVRDPYMRGREAAETAATHIRSSIDAMASALGDMPR